MLPSWLAFTLTAEVVIPTFFPVIILEMKRLPKITRHGGAGGWIPVPEGQSLPSTLSGFRALIRFYVLGDRGSISGKGGKKGKEVVSLILHPTRQTKLRLSGLSRDFPKVPESSFLKGEQGTNRDPKMKMGKGHQIGVGTDS